MSGTTAVGVECPICSGPMWDNRTDKRTPKSPDYRCKDKACEGRIWLEKKKASPNAGSEAKEPDAAPISFEQITARYAECMRYAVSAIVPGLEKHKITVDAQAVHAIAATLFIARMNRGI